ncbi:hypothetical protein AMTR_s00044p00119950 [Amborella trichopoda]|uniref:Uncharacterized protein n=1 Tax=Amborella trichopoda TaxID=13333 RepID=U5D9T0_AMBTC|nr:hypothetical protein AMTR_s00044p00119950 [Amborella trichopoda]
MVPIISKEIAAPRSPDRALINELTGYLLQSLSNTTSVAIRPNRNAIELATKSVKDHAQIDHQSYISRILVEKIVP